MISDTFQQQKLPAYFSALSGTTQETHPFFNFFVPPCLKQPRPWPHQRLHRPAWSLEPGETSDMTRSRKHPEKSRKYIQTLYNMYTVPYHYHSDLPFLDT